MPVSTVDELLAVVQADLAAKRTEAEDRVGHLKTAANEYLRAVEADLVSQAAARCGLEASRPPTAGAAALALRALAEALPEGRAKTEALPEPREPTTHGGTKLSPPAPAARLEVAPEVDVLYREFQVTGFDALPDALFKPTAEEFACRARALQAQSLADPASLLTKMFRTLTAKSFQRNLRDVFGLARNHQGDWLARAERA